MSFLLDSNTCIQFLNRRSEPLIRRLTDTPDEEILVCSVVKAELFFGARKSRDPQRSRQVQERFFERYSSLPFDDEAALTYADIRAHLERAGTPIGSNDLLIASIARSHDLVFSGCHDRGEDGSFTRRRMSVRGEFRAALGDTKPKPM